MEIQGKLIKTLPVQTGTTQKNVDWQKMEFVIETNEAYPKKVCMAVWGEDKVQELSKLPLNTVIKAEINIESREYNNRWYTDVKVWKFEALKAGASQSNSSGEQDDLPF